MSKFVAFLKNKSGATAIEYGLIAAGISVAIIAVVNGLGTKLNDTFTSVLDPAQVKLGIHVARAKPPATAASLVWFAAMALGTSASGETYASRSRRAPAARPTSPPERRRIGNAEILPSFSSAVCPQIAPRYRTDRGLPAGGRSSPIGLLKTTNLGRLIPRRPFAFLAAFDRGGARRLIAPRSKVSAMAEFVVEFGKSGAMPDGRLNAPAFQRNHEAIWSAIGRFLSERRPATCWSLAAARDSTSRPSPRARRS